MGVGFYSKIRSGVSSDSASINDIYQKLKEGIVGFSVADVLEDRISNLIEPLKISETFRLHSSLKPDEDDINVLEDFELFRQLKENSIIFPSVPESIYTQNIPIKSGQSFIYTNDTFIVPNYGTSPSLNRLRSKDIWFIVRGDFSISNGTKTIIDQDTLGSQYDASSTNFTIVLVSFISGQNVTYTVGSNTAITLTGVVFNDQIQGTIILDGDLNSIFVIELDSGTDNNGVTNLSQRQFIINNMEFGFFGNGRIDSSSRLPMYIA